MADGAQDANGTVDTDAIRPNRLRPLIWGGAAALLLLPAVAMRFTREVAWDMADFAIFGVMLVVACGAYEIAARLTDARGTRATVGVAIVIAFLLTWAELAVGIFD